MKARRPPPPMPALAKQPSTRPKNFQRRLHRGLDGGGIADVADFGIDLAGPLGHARGGACVLVGVAAPDRDVAAGGVERLRDAEADAAIAAGDHGGAAGEVENAHGFSSCRAPSGGQMFGSKHGQGHQENQIWGRTPQLTLSRTDSA